MRTRTMETCPFIRNVEKISGPKRSIKITDHFTCTSANVIYCIACTLCKKLYIGEKGRRLDDRFREHLRDVEKDDKNASKPVANHSKQQMAVCGLSLHQGSMEKLYIGEKGRRLDDRFREHLRDVEKDDKNASKPVANHSKQQMAVCGLSLHQGSMEKLYIGEKGRRLDDRFREHLRDVEKDDKNASKPVANHSKQHMAVCGLSLHQGSMESRKTLEQNSFFKSALLTLTVSTNAFHSTNFVFHVIIHQPIV